MKCYSPYSLNFEELELIRLALNKYHNLASTKEGRSRTPFSPKMIKDVQEKIEAIRGPNPQQQAARSQGRKSAVWAPYIVTPDRDTKETK